MPPQDDAIADEELELEDEENLNDEPPAEEDEEDESELTAEEKLEKANAKLKKFRGMESFVDALDKDPSKIHDLRDAISGKRREEEPPPRREAAPVFQPPARKSDDEIRAERKALNEKIKNAMLDPDADILDVLDPLIDARAESRVNLLRRDAAGLLDTTAEQFLDRFVDSKAKNTVNASVFEAAKKIFLKETADLNRGQMMSLEKTFREKQLGYIWGSAVAEVLEKRVKAPARTPGTSGRGVVMARTPERRMPPGVNVLTEAEERVLLRQLGPVEGRKAIREENRERAGKGAA